MHAPREKVSAFIVSFNRAAIIGTCLRALRFADEVIVVDKSSTDDTPAIAARHADRVVTVPWSETVEETRTFAASLCTHDWILFFDDDECLSPEAAEFIQVELRAPRADIYEFARRDYILGVHDEHAYYWPEHHIRFFRRGAVTFAATVHAGLVRWSNQVLRVDASTGACIHHLSHQDVAQWIDKANRYTSRLDRVRPDHAGHDLTAFAHARIDHWIGRTRDTSPNGYPAAVALLRASYDLIDRLKVWEEERGLDGATLFSRICAALDAAVDGDAMPARTGEQVRAAPAIEPTVSVERMLRAGLHDLRTHHDATIRAMTERESALARELADAQKALCAERLRATTAEANATAAEANATAAKAKASAAEVNAMAHRQAAEHAEAAAAAAAVTASAATAALRAIEDSTFWRATAWPRRLAGYLRSVGAHNLADAGRKVRGWRPFARRDAGGRLSPSAETP